jgi:hypothetical protein
MRQNRRIDGACFMQPLEKEIHRRVMLKEDQATCGVTCGSRQHGSGSKMKPRYDLAAGNVSGYRV